MPPEQKPDSNTEQTDQPPAEAVAADAPAAVGAAGQTAPADALEKSNEELADQTIDATHPNNPDAAAGQKADSDAPAKKPNAVKAFFHRANIYLLIFILLVVIAGVITIVAYLNGRKAPPVAVVPSQTLTQDDLKNLANSDATVGSSAQTLTIQGNAVFNGQILGRSDLAIAGNLQIGGSFNTSNLTVSGKSNLADTQINSLQVAQNTTIQGATTLTSLNVAGATAFHGPITASQITVTKLIFSGNAVMEVPNHLAFTGATPLRRIDPNVLGAGGSSSLNGSDTSGTINIDTGSNPRAGCFASITFNQPFASQPRVIVSPVGSAAGLLQYYINRNTTGFSLCANNAPAANQVFAFDYFVAD